MSNLSANQGNIFSNIQQTPSAQQTPNFQQSPPIQQTQPFQQPSSANLNLNEVGANNCNVPCNDTLLQPQNMLGSQIVGETLVQKPFSCIIDKIGKFVFFGYEVPGIYVVGFLMLGVTLAAYYVYSKYYKNEDEQQKQQKDDQLELRDDQYYQPMSQPNFMYEEQTIPPYPKNENQFPLMGGQQYQQKRPDVNKQPVEEKK